MTLAKMTDKIPHGWWKMRDGHGIEMRLRVDLLHQKNELPKAYSKTHAFNFVEKGWHNIYRRFISVIYIYRKYQKYRKIRYFRYFFDIFENITIFSIPGVEQHMRVCRRLTKSSLTHVWAGAYEWTYRLTLYASVPQDKFPHDKTFYDKAPSTMLYFHRHLTRTRATLICVYTNKTRVLANFWGRRQS